VKQTNPLKQKNDMNEICYEKVLESVLAGNQVMVFVHSRKDTANTAQKLVEMARERRTLGMKLVSRHINQLSINVQLV
jgi:activating signal cointegrator complex subunit 3